MIECGSCDKPADEIATFGEIVTEFTIEKRYDVEVVEEQEVVELQEQEQEEEDVEFHDHYLD